MPLSAKRPSNSSRPTHRVAVAVVEALEGQAVEEAEARVLVDLVDLVDLVALVDLVDLVDLMGLVAEDLMGPVAEDLMGPVAEDLADLVAEDPEEKAANVLHSAKAFHCLLPM